MDVEFRDRAAYLPAADTVVVADLHLGRDAASAVELPLGERDDLLDRLHHLLDVFQPSAMVLAGDVLHAFSNVPEGVETTLDDLATLVANAGSDLVVTPGNHDPMLDTAFDDGAEHRLSDGETVVLHGHEPPATQAERYVIGHDHPAIVVEGQKHPCMLYGSNVYQGADVLVLPAFNRLAEGTAVNDMRAREFMSPLVANGASLDQYRPFVWDKTAGDSLAFPPLGEFRQLL